jgi:dethiobiotin synthetase
VSTLVITGTGTDVGKTVVTAAIATLAVRRGAKVAVLKAAQTGLGPDEPGDAAEVARLAGPVTTAELRRFPDPLAPDTAARLAGLPPVQPADVVAAVTELDIDHDLVLVEGAGGLAVRFDAAGATLADVAAKLHAPTLVVAGAELGTLNVTALTCEALERRELACAGVVIGSWPAQPDLAARCNAADLPVTAAAPLLGALPQGAAGLDAAEFAEVSRLSLAPPLGGDFDAVEFVSSVSVARADAPG